MTTNNKTNNFRIKTGKDIKNLLRKGERINLECKKAKTSVPESLWESYSAFANTYGGTILLGIYEDLQEKDLSKRFIVTGVDDADKICVDLWNTLNNNEKVNINLLHDDDVKVIDIDGKNVVAVCVPRASYNERPIILKNDLRRGVFKRNNEGDYHVSDSELRMILRDANEDGNDGLLVEYYTMNDIDVPTLNRYRMLFSLRNPDHVWNNCNDEDFLRQLGGLAKNREDGKEWLTMAGLLMFGQGLPIRERFDNIRLDYIDMTDLIGDQRWSDRLTYDGTWENNIFNFLRMVMPRLTRDLPRPFKMEGVERDDDSLQHKAVREAFTNSIIHSDFMLDGVLKVEKLDNEFVFTNSGLLKLPVEQIYHGGVSKARNKRMQNMLRMIGYGENMGSGFPLIVHAWDENHWVKPELSEQSQLLQVQLKLHVLKNVPVNVQKDVQKDVQKQLTDRQKVILKMIAFDGCISYEEMSKKIDASAKTIQREVDILRKMGYVAREGGRKNGEWIILKK